MSLLKKYQGQDQYPGYNFEKPTAWEAREADRATFILNTYVHLFAAVAAFVGLEALLLSTPAAEVLAKVVFGTGKLGWFIILLVFIGVGHVAEWFANNDTSRPVQYFGLGLYIVAETAIFAPLLWVAHTFYPHAIPTAGLMTGIIFSGLTGFAILTRYDFSFLRGFLTVAALAALGLIAGSMIFGFSLGLVFVVAMIALSGLYILYDTSNVMHHYRTDQHVAASLALFASLALLFWYVLQFVMRLQGGGGSSSASADLDD